MSSYLNSYIIQQFLSIPDDQKEAFIKRLKPETREYLDIILEKAEKDPARLKRFLDLG